MGFFNNLKLRRRLKQKKAAVVENPSPLATKELIEAYLLTGQADNAFDVAEQGVGIYPRSSTIREIYQKLCKIRHSDTIKSLQSEIENKPNPISYARLADLLYNIGRNDEALKVCWQGLERYPEYEGNYLIAGKIRFQRFREDYIAKDGRTALEYFERALILNPSNYKTLLQLAEIYTEIGAFQKALEKLNNILATHPADERSIQLKDYIEQIGAGGNEDIDELLSRVEELKGKKGCVSEDDPDLWAISATCEDLSEIEHKLQYFHNIEGFLGVSVFELNGDPVSTLLNWEVDEALFQGALKQVFTNAQDSSLRLDIGRIEDAVISTPIFKIVVFTFGPLAFVLMVMPETKEADVESVVNSFINSELYSYRA